MARLSDYGINVEDLKNSATVSIQGVEFPISFTMQTMEFIADVYGGDYSQFESDMNAMLYKKEGKISSANLSPSDLKIMRALIYAMLRTGGLEEDPETIFKFLGMSGEVLSAYSTCMEIFASQTFQVEDLKKSKKPQDFQKAQAKRKKNKKNRKR
ncbi:hypothetical protein BH747_13700 [Enterococcus villorum]|uniref:Phage protein n=2 Tax=Enterococcus villorum TaxID=112904 RepID=A0A1V8Y580_9ENTE|nr:hypothetical protein [Enterococcus villorum]EMF0283824.1 hypothetical protein [Enterococcus hirae]EOH87600.1 hypothetical protein UAO_02311 [Enterococcus villorum ATCC 700913]EOW77681.1 hypothetical protein I591_00535 [Enterococcus villorum ATCC 700913]OQO67771.1 hypothetical protein BH747_13700 [Enterococcus villorum]OQO72014.1 hypothetical protein BH744_12425 [Enterococcus villorum]